MVGQHHCTDVCSELLNMFSPYAMSVWKYFCSSCSSCFECHFPQCLSLRSHSVLWQLSTDMISMWICWMYMLTKTHSIALTNSISSTIPVARAGSERFSWSKTILSKVRLTILLGLVSFGMVIMLRGCVLTAWPFPSLLATSYVALPSGFDFVSMYC